MIRTITLAIVFALTLPALAQEQPTDASRPTPHAPPPTTDAQRLDRWQQDLDFLVEEFPKKHKNAFFKCSEEQWRARAGEVRAKLPELSDAGVLLELRRLIALLGDGHSHISAGNAASIPPARALPIATIWLSDGVYAPIMPREHEALIGQKLVRIGSTSIDEVVKKLAELHAYDNESGMKNGVMNDLRLADVLYHLAVVESPDSVAFTFEDAKRAHTTITLSPIPAGADMSQLIVQKPDPGSYPAWRALRRFPYGHEHLADSRTFYIWYDTCANHPDKPVAQFIDETLAALDERLPETDRVVIDFRRNGGGNSVLFMPMIENLAKRDTLKQRGRLFGLIGRRTFSSGMMNAYQLRNVTGCFLVGEPTGGTPNGYGEVRTFTLPNSKLTVQYSTKLFRGVKEEADAIYPDLKVAPWSRAYFEGRDVVLERVIKWEPR